MRTNMLARSFLFAALLSVLAAAGTPAQAQQAVIENCTVLNADAAYSPGTARPCTQDTTGRTRVTMAGSASPPPVTATVTGTVASAATLSNFPVDAGALGYVNVVVQFTSVGSGNTVIFEGSNDNTTYNQLQGSYAGDPNTALLASGIVGPTTSGANALYMYQIPTKYFRVRVSAYGSGTVTVVAHFSSVKYTQPSILQVKSNGTGSVGNVVAVGSDADDAAATQTQIVPVGGIYNGTVPTYTTGDRTQFQFGSRGSALTTVCGSGQASCATTTAITADGLSASQTGLITASSGLDFNGSTYDRGFVCPNSAQATVTAGSTTQLVALASSQIIRVCSYQVGIATTGTFSFVYGTGANCGTGTTTITPATTLTAGNVVTRTDNGGALRTIASNALCLAAVTGNVQVHLTYAQY